MANESMDRRQFFSRVVRGGVVLAGAMLVLPACEKSSSGGGGGAPAGGGAKKTDCADLSGLTEAEMSSRTGLQYVDKTPDPAKKCRDCALFKKEGPCNSCTVVKGPIAEAGYCTAWAPKS